MSQNETRMQTFFVAALLLLGSLSLPLTGCREKTLGEKIGDKIDDGLDQRPAETVRDKVEDIKN